MLILKGGRRCKKVDIDWYKWERQYSKNHEAWQMVLNTIIQNAQLSQKATNNTSNIKA